MLDLRPVEELVERHRGQRGVLIPLLQRVQEIYGYVPKEAVDLLARELDVYPVQIYGILTFYAFFRLTPRGKHTIKVCLGTACHVMGSQDILDYLCHKLGVRPGETTADGQFTVERVACVGCCGMAPVVVVDEQPFGHTTIQKADELVARYSAA